ncbi:hypothetical protein LWI28_009767 [Acer negundo]|uniref:Legume lectin domain-containing protein n=1 Tax=Acer negundo TaxID=4023 RepID=A0AAD5IU26_ACENE|nr:hypothetical protein LWI28_009767 [Acer negundo]
MHIWDKVSRNLADFTTHFSFAINSQIREIYADGFAFFLASNGSTLQLNSEGGNLGLLSSNQTLHFANYSFVAVEFDTFQNCWDTTNHVHVGIDLNSVNSINIANWSWSDISKGRKAEAWINYNSSSKNLSLLLVDADDKSYPRNSTSLYSILDLRDYLSEWVTFGFSGATGALFETHTIYSWNFSSSLQENIAPVAPMPSPSTGRYSKMWRVVVLAVGGGALVFVGSIIGLVWFCCWMKRNKTEKGGHTTFVDAEIQGAIGPRKFSIEELVVATNNFSDEGLLGEGEDICAAADPRLGHDYDKEQMEHLIIVGLACAQPNQEDRPSIKQALDMLNFKASLPVLPLEMLVPKQITTLLASVHSNAGSSFKAASASPNTTSSKSTASSTYSNTTSGVTKATS